MIRRRSLPGSTAGARLRSHLTEWPLLVVLVGGTVLRVAAMVAYRPALLTPDGTAYLATADRLEPGIDRPAGYALFLRAVGAGRDLSIVPTVQHLMVLQLIVVLYVLLRRRSVPAVAAGLALLPLALDARQVSIEHMILTETVFLVLVLVAVLFLTLPRRVSPAAAMAAGLALGCAGVARSTGLPLLVLFLAFLVMTRARWVLYAALVAGLLLPVGSYAIWYHHSHGAFALSQYNGHFLYGRVAGFADCSGVEGLTAQEAGLCETTDRSTRGNATFYVWSSDSPATNFPGVAGDEVLGSFARKVLLAHPLTWVQYTLRDTLPYFVPLGPPGVPFICDLTYRFPQDATDADCFVYVANQTMSGEPAQPAYADMPGRFLQDYQDRFTTPPLAFGVLTVVLASAVLVGIRRRRFRQQAPALLIGGIGLGLVVLSSATTMYDVRYGFQLTAMLPVAVALSLSSLRRGDRARPGQVDRRRSVDDEADPDGRVRTDTLATVTV